MTKVSKTKEPLISVIVPIYQSEEFLEKCLESIINQTYKNLEIILVDDGSPDNCPYICDEYKKKDKRIKVIHKENEGVSAARNDGIKIATGEYIGYVDSDDWIESNMYSVLYDNMQKYNADISICALERRTGYDYKINNSNVKIETYNQEKYLLRFFKIGYQQIEYYPPNKLFKRNLIEENQFPIGLTSEDVFGTYKAVLKANKIVKTTEVLYNYRFNENGITGSFSENDYDLLTIWDMVVDYTKKHASQYYDYALINRQRVDFTLLYRIAKEFKLKEIKKNERVKPLLKSLKSNEKSLLKSKIAFSRKVLIWCFCRNYYFFAAIL